MANVSQPAAPSQGQSSPQSRASWKAAILSPVLLLALNLFVFGTMTVYFGNQGEFLVEDEDVLLLLLVPAALFTLVLLLFSYPPSRRHQAATASVLFFLAFASYLHGNVLRWDAGILDGAALETGRTLPLLADLVLWLVLGWTVWRYRLWLVRHGWKICIALMLFQLVGAITLKHNAKVGNRQLQDVPAELYAFNAGPNVLHLILDGFQGNVFESLWQEDPSLAEALEGFVYFRDTLTPSAVTYLSVPATLSGKAFDNSTTITQYHDESLGGENLYSYFAGNGYAVDVASPVWWNLHRSDFSSYYSVPAPFASLADTIRNTAWYLLDISLFRQAPYALKSLVYRNGAWLFSSRLAGQPGQRFQHFAHTAFMTDLATKANAGRAKPTYKLVHVITPHAPLVSEQDCSYAGREFEISMQAFADQSRCTLVTVKTVLDKLKALGIYDETMIIIHGDHGGGVAFDMTSGEGRATRSFDVLPGLWGNPLPLLLVKKPGAKGPLVASNRPVSLIDIPVTVSETLKIPAGFPGVSLFSERPPTARRMYYNSEQHRNEAMEKGRFADFTSYAVDGSIFSVEAWSQVGQFEASDEDLAGQYVLGTPLSFGRSGSFKPFGAGGWTVTRNNDINWTQGRESGLLLPIGQTGGDLVLTFTVKPLLVAGQLDRQRVTVLVNDQELDSLELTEGRFKTHSVTIPSALTENGRLSIRFLLPDAASPLVLGSGEDERELAVAFLKVQVDRLQ